MIANAAFLAGVTVFLGIAWLAGEASFLAPYRTAIFRHHGRLLAGAVLLVFVNLCAVYYGIARWLFLRDAGRKLQYLDRQFTVPDTAVDERRLHLKS